MKYTIYHIPGVKVGCTSKSPEKRVKAQGYVEFEVLAIVEDAIHASELEVQWQERLGYGRDNKSYTSTVKAGRIANIPENKAKIKKPILQFDKKGNFIKMWPGSIDACRDLNIDKGDLCSCLKGKYKTAGGFIWKYSNPQV
jgi:hypothetical protein